MTELFETQPIYPQNNQRFNLSGIKEASRFLEQFRLMILDTLANILHNRAISIWYVAIEFHADHLLGIKVVSKHPRTDEPVSIKRAFTQEQISVWAGGMADEVMKDLAKEIAHKTHAKLAEEPFDD